MSKSVPEHRRKTVRILVRVDPETAAGLDRIALEEGVSKAEILRKVVRALESGELALGLL